MRIKSINSGSWWFICSVSVQPLLGTAGPVSVVPVLTGPDMAYLGSRVAFRCFVPNSPLPVTYELMRDGGVLIASGANLQGEQPASFFLKVVAASEGSYRCRATSEGGSGLSSSLRLTVVSEFLTSQTPPGDPVPPNHLSLLHLQLQRPTPE